MKTALLVDIDGTLIDSNEAHARSWVKVLERHGHPVTYERVRPLIGKGGDKLLAEAAGIDHRSDEGKRVAEARARLFKEEFLSTLRATPGARNLLERIRSLGLRVVAATSGEAGDAEALLKQAGLDGLLSDLVTSEDARESKPDPDIVQSAMRKAGARPEATLMLGDTPYDVQAAHRAGVDAIALRCGGWWADEAFVGAVAVYDDPAALLTAIDQRALHMFEPARFL